jgi:RNA polymerase sigma factor (TIGR02999 family)
MSDESGGEITRALAALRRGEGGAMERLMELVYQDLRRKAHFQLGARGGTLSTTALVHETYLRLAAAKPDWQDRHHFFNVAAKAMRQIVIDFARERMAQKRGGGRAPIELEEGMAAVESRAEELLTIEAALRRLEAEDGRLARVVELRFFGGLTVEEIADVLGVDPRTVKRDWQKALSLLRSYLEAGSPA